MGDITTKLAWCAIEGFTKLGSLTYIINEVAKDKLDWWDVVGAGLVYSVGVGIDKAHQAYDRRNAAGIPTLRF